MKNVSLEDGQFPLLKMNLVYTEHKKRSGH